MSSGLVVPAQKVGVHGRYKVEKYYAGDDLARATPYEVIETDNLLLTAGATLMLNRLAGITATAIDATNGRIAVGDGTAAVSAGQTDLQGTNKYRQVFDAVPTVSSNQLQAVTTVGTANANFHWQEIGAANASSGATLVTRALQDFGTKTSSLQWVVTWTLTLN